MLDDRISEKQIVHGKLSSQQVLKLLAQTPLVSLNAIERNIRQIELCLEVPLNILFASYLLGRLLLVAILLVNVERLSSWCLLLTLSLRVLLLTLELWLLDEKLL